MRRRVIEAVLNDILGLHSKPKAAVDWVHKVTGCKKKEKKKEKKKKEEKKNKQQQQQGTDYELPEDDTIVSKHVGGVC